MYLQRNIQMLDNTNGLEKVLHMDDERIAKIVLHGKVEVSSKRGNLRTTRMIAIEKRTEIRLPRATELIQDREKWIKLVVTFGAYARPTRL